MHSELASLPCHEADAAPTLASQGSPSTEPATHADCAQCSTCQVCHGVVMFSGVSPLPILALPTQVAHSGQALFASVPRAPHLKPPIS